MRKAARALLIPLLAAFALSGCEGLRETKTHYVSRAGGFRVGKLPPERWRRTPDAADVLALNDPSTSVLYFSNPYTGGVIALQVLPRHYSEKAAFMDEMRYIYRRMLSAPFADVRAVSGGAHAPFGKAVRLSESRGALRGEFHLRGRMGGRPTARARERARARLDEELPFGGARTREELAGERKFRQASLASPHSADYRGKVVVLLRKGKLYEFYYVERAPMFGAGLRAFDAFVESFEFLPS